MMDLDTSITEGLLENGIDSIRHASDHFFARNHENRKSNHDDKWIVLSVHHAAECICNALLLKIDPNCPSFNRKKDKSIWYPCLNETLKKLQSASNRQKLTEAELHLLKLLKQLPEIRNEFMHRVSPENVDVSISAMCLIGILKHIEIKHKTKAFDIVWQSSPIETDIIASIRYQRLKEYGEFVESFLREKYVGLLLQECPSCAALSVINSRCEACFEELEEITCPECDVEVLFPSWEKQTGSALVVCPNCGKQVNIS